MTGQQTDQQTDQRLELLPAVDISGGQAVQLVQGVAGSGGALRRPVGGRAGLAGRGSRVDPPRRPRRRLRARQQPRAASPRSSAGSTCRSSCSGGIRDTDSLEAALATGCRRVHIGTAALEDPAWTASIIAEHGDRVAIGLDVRGTTLAARGWTREGGDLWETLERLDREGSPLRRHRCQQGRHAPGPQREVAPRRVRAHHRAVVASGGVSTLEDIAVIRGLVGDGVEGAIVGSASTAVPSRSPRPSTWRAGQPVSEVPTTPRPDMGGQVIPSHGFAGDTAGPTPRSSTRSSLRRRPVTAARLPRRRPRRSRQR